MKRLSVVFMMVAAFGLMTATAAQAVAPQKATGSIRMGTGTETDPKQAISFDVFEATATAPVKGNIAYTNFGLADAGSGVWVPAGTFNVSFEYQGLCQGNCMHSLTVTDFQQLSPNSVSFEGTGFYVPNAAWTETFTGTIVGDQVELTLVPDDGGALYGWSFTDVVGTIGAGGSISGVWDDSLLRSGTFEVAAGAASEVFSFRTTPTCVQVDPENHRAWFGYTIPAGAPAELAGQHVAVKVRDNGTPGTGDVYKHNFAEGLGSCLPFGETYTQYPITAGNLTVFS
jgi:hypothetical protein